MAQVLIILSLVYINLFGSFKVKSYQELKYQGVTKQTFEESCGASALSTLFKLFNYEVGEAELIRDLNTTYSVDFTELQKVAQKHNFNAKGYQVSKEIFETIKLPVIARIIRRKEYPHFVVVQNLPGDFVIILDPNAGKFLITKNEFYETV
jgi:predicted double-glycine peptidase